MAHALARLLCLAVVLTQAGPAHAQAETEAYAEAVALPGFEELEAAGAVIGIVRIDTRDIFDLSDPKENNRLFRLANRLHYRTRPATVAHQLLFKSGDRVSAHAIAESERLLRANRYLYDVEIRPAAYRDGVVDIDVITRDTWTLDPGFSFARTGGANSGRFYLNEGNFLGSGISVGIARSSNVDRAGTTLSFSDKHLFGPWLSLDASLSRLTDGRQWAFAVGRPFFTAQAPWAATLSASDSDVVNGIFDKGERVAGYRARQSTLLASAGKASVGEGGTVRRYTAGYDYQRATYEPEPGLPPPDPLPRDRILSGPFLGYELLSESYEKVLNRDQIGRTEYFALGSKAAVQVGRSLTQLGATTNAWIVSLNASRGQHVFGSHSLFLSAGISGRIEQGARQNQLVSASARYFIPQRHDAVFALSASADVYRHPDLATPLQLGGDNGLRGYPLSFQSGERRFLFTAEERVYTDWYPYRLFRVGGAVFFDAGRAWHGVGERTAGEHTLTDAGIGLRVQNTRSSTGGVLHLDLAFPLNARSETKSVQILLKSYTAF